MQTAAADLRAHKAKDPMAHAFQREIDHLDGILIFDVGALKRDGSGITTHQLPQRNRHVRSMVLTCELRDRRQ